MNVDSKSPCHFHGLHFVNTYMHTWSFTASPCSPRMASVRLVRRERNVIKQLLFASLSMCRIAALGRNWRLHNKGTSPLICLKSWYIYNKYTHHAISMVYNWTLTNSAASRFFYLFFCAENEPTTIARQWDEEKQYTWKKKHRKKMIILRVICLQWTNRPYSVIIIYGYLSMACKKEDG